MQGAVVHAGNVAQQQPLAGLQLKPSVLHTTATALHLCSPPAAPQFQGACFKDDRTLLVTEYMEVSSAC